MSTTVLLWSTIIGYLLSLDLITGVSYSLYQSLKKWRVKKKFQKQNGNSEPTKCEFSTTRRKKESKETKSMVISSKKSLFSNTGLDLSSSVVNKCVTIFFHATFFVLSIIIVLFVPSSPTYDSPAANYTDNSPDSESHHRIINAANHMNSTTSNVSNEVRNSSYNYELYLHDIATHII